MKTLKGTLHRYEGYWFVRHLKSSPDSPGLQVAVELPLHPDQADGYEWEYQSINATYFLPKDAEFEVETIAMGTSENDVMDCDVAVLINY